MKRNIKLLLIVLPIVLISTKAFAEEIDYEAINDEENKQIVPFNPENAHEQYRSMEEAMNQMDALDDFNYEDIDFLPDTKRSPEEEKKELERRKESEKKFWATEKSIYDQIKKLEINYPEPEITALREEWQKAMKAETTKDYPSDLAKKIGSKLAEKKLYDLAIKFYHLSMSSDRSGLDEFLLIGDAHIDEYNALVRHQRPKEPNEQLFSLLTKAIYAYQNGAYCCEVGDFLASDLKRLRDKMVRWPFSPRKVLNDNYYGTQKLAEKLYPYGFVDSLLKDIQNLRKIFSAQKCDSSKSEENLAQALYDAGFYGVSKFYNGAHQYIFANSKGYVVRIKQNPEFKNWEFTIGLTFMNPFKWYENNKDEFAASGLVKKTDVMFDQTQYHFGFSGELVTHQYNEIFKIVFHNDVPMVVPAFRDFYWSDHVNKNTFLRAAHGRLKNRVEHKKIQKYLGF